MGIESLISNDRVDQSLSSATRSIPSLRDVAVDAVNNTRLNFMAESRELAIGDEFNKRDAALRSIDGNDIYQTLKAGPSIAQRGNDFQSRVNNKLVDDYITQKRLTDQRYNSVALSSEIEQSAYKRSNEASEKYAETMRLAPDGIGKSVTSFVGGTLPSLGSPINIASMMFGAGQARTILQTIAIEGAINAGAEASSQIPISGWQKELGKEYGLGDAAINIASAGVLGGAIGGAVKGVGMAVKPAASFVFKQTAKIPGITTDMKASLEAMARKAELKESNPVFDPTIEQQAAHQENIQNVMDALEQGKKVSDVELKLTEDDILQSVERRANDYNAPIKEKMLDDIGYKIDSEGNITREVSSDVFQQATTTEGKLITLNDIVKQDKQELLGADQHITQLVDQLIKPTPSPKVETLVQWIRKQGGAKDDGGELRALDATKIKGLVKKGGVSLDELALKAQEQGFFDSFQGETFNGRATKNNLIEAIRRDLTNGDVVRTADLEKINANKERLRNIDDFEQYLRSNNINTGGDKIQILADMRAKGLIKDSAEDFVRNEIPELLDDSIQVKSYEQINKELERSPELDSATKQEFDSIVKEHADKLESTMIELDERTISLKDLIEETKRNERTMSEVTSCAFGGNG